MQEAVSDVCNLQTPKSNHDGIYYFCQSFTPVCALHTYAKITHETINEASVA